jgi:ABC-type lipoprotein release transport system permease subunit
MSAVWMRFGSEARAHWRAWLALTLIAGVFGGVVLAAANGAARADSVTDRTIARTKPPDIYLVPVFATSGDPALLAKLSYEHLVAMRSVADGIKAVILETNGNLDVSVPADDRLGRTLFIPKLLEGRLPDPDRVDEAAVNILAAEKLHLHPGDTFALRFDKPHPIGGPYLAGPTMKVRVVGVTAGVGDVISVAAPGFSLTPAFLARYGASIATYDLVGLYLRPGRGAIDAFAREMSSLSGGKYVFYVEGRSGEQQARRSFRLQGTSLWIFAGFLGLVALLMLGQMIARQTFLDSADDPVLKALGFGRGQLVGLAFLRMGLVGALGGIIATVIGAIGSIATPFGLARVIEPDPGVRMPAISLIAGLGGTLLVVLILAAYPAWRTARTPGSDPGAVGASLKKPSALRELIVRIARGPAAAVGTRMALEPGSGRTSVPVRTTIAGTSIGIVSLIVALIFASSLHRLTITPRLYGFNWDLRMTGGADFRDPVARAKLSSTPGIADFSVGIQGGTLTVNGKAVDVFTIELGARVHPPLLEGRAPAAADEVALGRKTLRAVGARVGGTVSLQVQGQSSARRCRVVGVTVLPLASDTSALGEGVWASLDLERSLLPNEDIPNEVALIRLAPGASAEKVTRLIRSRFTDPSLEQDAPPGAVVDFGRVSTMPAALAGVVGLLAAGTLAIGVTTSARRRRRDLAILKTIGFDRSEVRRAVAWQASVTALMTLAIGLPIGVAAGRWIWIAFANQSGFVAEPVVSLPVLALTVGGGLLLANIIAAFPARSASRTRPALILRTE